jgi:hypothetical protein
MTTIEKYTHRQHVNAFRTQMRQFLMTSRFNNSTLEENHSFRKQNPKIGCIYCSPSKIADHVPIDSIMFILEMNNDTNRIEGVGMVRNHPYVNKYSVYKNGNYNRYVYTGKYRIDRTTMTEEEEKIMTVFDIFCFTGNRHLKRGQGVKSFPPETLYRCSRTMDLVAFISNMFKTRIQ